MYAYPVVPCRHIHSASAAPDFTPVFAERACDMDLALHGLARIAKQLYSGECPQLDAGAYSEPAPIRKTGVLVLYKFSKSLQGGRIKFSYPGFLTLFFLHSGIFL